MEIIKEIKLAEKEAKQIIDNAQANAEASLENARKQRAAKLESRRLERRRAIDAAVLEASVQAENDAASLGDEAKHTCEEIAGQSRKSVDKAVEKVLDFINTLSEK